jgi:hypothetical protein
MNMNKGMKLGEGPAMTGCRRCHKCDRLRAHIVCLPEWEIGKDKKRE